MTSWRVIEGIILMSILFALLFCYAGWHGKTTSRPSTQRSVSHSVNTETPAPGSTPCGRRWRAGTSWPCCRSSLREWTWWSISLLANMNMWVKTASQTLDLSRSVLEINQIRVICGDGICMLSCVLLGEITQRGVWWFSLNVLNII